MATHDGARDRLRQRFREHGLDNFNDYSLLELLLFYAIPRRETNTIAHALIDHFGSLSAVIEAPCEALMEVEGVGEHTAMFLNLIAQVDRRYMISKNAVQDIINTSFDAVKILVPLYRFAREEIVYLLCLDNKNGLISCDKLGQGTLGEASVSVRALVETALRRNAASVILSHNHVDGIALPSHEDEITTHYIEKALIMVGITLMDHIIIAGDDYVSLADSNLLSRPQPN